MSRRDDTVSLRHMLDYARTACRLATDRVRADLASDEMLQLALTRAVEVVGEAARRVTQEGRARYTGIPWLEITGTRDRLIHGYDKVDLDLLWNIITVDLPPLIAELERILDALGGTEQR